MSDDDECSLWIAGDTNLPDIDWTNNAIVGHQYVKQIDDDPGHGPNKPEHCSGYFIIDFYRKARTIPNTFGFVRECSVLFGGVQSSENFSKAYKIQTIALQLNLTQKSKIMKINSLI